MHIVEQVHAILLAGGSAFGLDAAGGVVRYLEERGVGFDVRIARVPIVPAAILFDLSIGRSDVRPNADMGYRACSNASVHPPQEGNVGAGIGATVGKALGIEQAMKSGVGSAGFELGGGLVVAALAAVNAFGDIIDPQVGQIIAGTRRKQEGSLQTDATTYFADSLEVMRSRIGQTKQGFAANENTVIGIVATNARLTKEQANKMAQMAQDGLARTVRPAHTMFDGDTIFSLSTGTHPPADVSTLGAFAAEMFAQAVVRAVRMAEPAAGLPSAGQLSRSR
jgi:L-aminopeptidase/D-esterase-like protein